jgi:hypothetical protein
VREKGKKKEKKKEKFSFGSAFSKLQWLASARREFREGVGSGN